MKNLSNNNNPEETTFVFIDAANIIYGCGKVGWKMDFEKLARYLKNRFNPVKILYYAGLDSENKKQILFYELLHKLNYDVKLVPVKQFKDGKRKGDVDARLTFEAMKYFNDYTKAIFLTGDGDYYWLIEYLLEKGKKIKLMAHSKNTARDLKKLFGGEFTDIARLKGLLQFNEK